MVKEKSQLQGRRSEKKPTAELERSFYVCVADCILQDIGGKKNRPVTCSSVAHGDRVPDVISTDGRLSEKLTSDHLRRLDDPNTKISAKFGLLSSPSEYEMERAIPVKLSPALMEGGS